MTIARLLVQGEYLGFDENLKGYVYTYNDYTFLWNGDGLNEI